MNENLSKDIRFLKGVGPQKAFKLKQAGILTIADLLLYIPRTYTEREYCGKIESMEPGKRYKILLQLKSIKQIFIKGRGRQLRAIFTDGNKEISAAWFNFQFWQLSRLQPGVKVLLEGELREYRNNLQLVHPAYEIVEEDISREETAEYEKGDDRIIPVYPLTAELNQNILRKLIRQAYQDYQEFISETLPAGILQKHLLLSLSDSIRILHFPQSLKEIETARKRLVFEELFYHQLMLARLYRKNSTDNNGISFEIKKKQTTRLKESLSFTLTTAQKRVLREIVADMESSRRMNRLLQGDVGSGKTIVALFAMLLAIENGYQAVMLVPTEILAKQHFQTITNLLADQPEIVISLLLGGKRKGSKEILKDIAAGVSRIIIGTHALLEQKVVFQRAGLVVIDEQQRFGVQQRAVLPARIGNPDILYLSATPIPRSLALTIYGDLDISVLDELPPFRKPVVTTQKTADRKGEVYQKIPGYIRQGKQIYMVCPLISETEKLDLLDAERLFRYLKDDVFPGYRIDLIHSRMKSAEKEAVMQRFQQRKTDILVSTTVIEVGVDVPNASVMIIEHAERFGLSQLHQLRGRVGRGSDESCCFLIAYKPVSATARKRLKIMTETTDGFLIAEKDLEIRGPGEFFGTNQSGIPLFRFTDLREDLEILRLARAEAREIALKDHTFSEPENSIIREQFRRLYREKEKLFNY
jgi:ATP-dependent DNA helicase RecG